MTADSPAVLIRRASERLRDGRVRINPGLGAKLACHAAVIDAVDIVRALREPE